MNIAEAYKYYEEEVKPIFSGGEFARRMKEAIDEVARLKEESSRLSESARYWQGESLKKTRKAYTYENAGCETHSEVESTEPVCLVCLIDDRDKLREFYNASVAEHRKSIELIDSLERQIEVLRPVYEAAKILSGACFFGKRKDVEAASLALRKAVDIAAGELEDSDE